MHSDIVTFAAANISSPAGVLFTNNRNATTAVVTFIGLVNTTGGQGATVLIVKNQGLSAQVPFHSGVEGAGTFDRFPLTCQVAVLTAENVGYIQNSGIWGIVVCGYYTPTVFTQ